MAKTKTDQYKEHLQSIILNATGHKVSRETAWSLFKDIIHGTVQFTTKQENLALPLSGVGKFQVLKTTPRGSKAGLMKDENGTWVPDPKGTAWEFVPRFRFYPSIAIDRGLEDLFGYGDHEGIEHKDYGIYAEGVEVPVVEESEESEATEEAPPAKEAKKPDLKPVPDPEPEEEAEFDFDDIDITEL